MAIAPALLQLKVPYGFPVIEQGVTTLTERRQFKQVICYPRIGRHPVTKALDPNLVEVLQVDADLDTVPEFSFCVSREDIGLWIWGDTTANLLNVAAVLEDGHGAGATDLTPHDIAIPYGAEGPAEIPLNIISAPAATTDTDAYTCPDYKTALIETLYICNRGAATTFRVWIAPAGVATANDQYLYYDTAIGANQTLKVDDVAARLSETDVLRVRSLSGDVTFRGVGIEFA